MPMPQELTSDFAREAAFGTPAVTVAAITANDVLIYVSVFYVLAQTAYLFWKWHREIITAVKERRNAKASRITEQR